MKKILYIIIIVLSFVSCRKNKAIPEDKLAVLIKEIIMANAYSSIHIEKMNADSFDIYSTIFRKYGYDTDDFKYTLNKIASRKSSRLSEILDDATQELRDLDNYFKYRTKTKEYIDSLIISEFKDTVYVQDAPFTVTEKNLKEKNRFALDVISGTYYVDFKYMLDSADANGYMTLRYGLVDTMGKTAKTATARIINKGKWQNVNFSLDTDDGTDSLFINFFDNLQRLKDPKLTVDSILVTWHEPIAELREIVTARFYPFEFKDLATNDDNEETEYSGPLYLLPEERADAEDDTDI